MKQNTRRGVFVLGGYQEVRSRITKYICSSSTPNLLSVLDPGSPVLRHGSALRFPDGSKAVCFLSRPLRKNPQEGIFTRWAATGNRTRTIGTTNRCTNRYTIAARCARMGVRWPIEWHYLYLFFWKKSSPFFVVRYTVAIWMKR